MPSHTLDEPRSRRYPRRSAGDDGYPRRPSNPHNDSYYDPRDKYYLSGDESDTGFQPSRYRSSSEAEGRELRRRSDASQTRDSERRHSVRSDRSSPDDRRRRPAAPRALSHTSPSSRSSTGSRPARNPRDRGGPQDRYYPPSASRSKGMKDPGSSRRPGPSRSSSASKVEKKSQSVVHSAVKVAMEAGAVAAFKARNDPSPWVGAKGTKVVAAALGAAVIDTYMNKKAPKRKGGLSHATLRQATQMAIGNLVLKPAVKGTALGRGM